MSTQQPGHGDISRETIDLGTALVIHESHNEDAWLQSDVVEVVRQ